MFDGLPSPMPGRLVLWFFGPGFGESVVGALPDGRWFVIDTCRWSRKVLPRMLLDRHSVRRIDLLVLTHPDLDHIGGLPGLVAGLEVGRIWRYPRHADIGDLVAGWIDRFRPQDRRLLALRRALATLDALEDADVRVVRAAYGRDRWPPGGDSPYRLHLLAPPDGDLRALEKQLEGLVETRSGRFVLNPRLERYLTGRSSHRPREANALSLAVALEWGPIRVVFGGDVERGAGDRRGWRGILQTLEEDGLMHLVEDIHLIKVSHHGSWGAYFKDAWRRHAGATSPIAVVTPFSRGRSPPPHRRALAGIRRHASRLGLTAAGAGSRRSALDSGWTPDLRGGAARAPCIAVVLDAHGTVELAAGREARIFRA